MTATCHQLGIAGYVDAVEREVARAADVIEGADPAAPIPRCEPWTIADLAEHIGGIHRWCEQMVRTVTPERIRGRADAPEPEKRAAWLREGGSQLVETFRRADPDVEMWSWGSDKHVRFWPRRMLHETGVHRADAERAAGIEPSFDTRNATDGVDEFLDNLSFARYFAPNVVNLRGDDDVIRFETDGAAWSIVLHPDRFDWSHDDADAAATVRARPGDLLLFVYGRIKPGEGVDVDGDDALLARWIENSKI